MENNKWWNSAPTRRRFIAFGVAGAVPFLAGGRRLFAQRAMVGSARPEVDPVVEEITREMARLHTSIRQRGLRPEHVHGIGAQVRVMLAHARAVDMDERVRNGIGLAIDRRGRDTLINMEVDQPTIAAGLKAIGKDVSGQTHLRALPRDVRVKMLDQLLASGVTSHLGRLELAMAETEIAADRNAIDLLAGPDIARVGCSDGWDMLEAEMEGAAMFCSWWAPELAAWFWGCYFGCERLEMLVCWEGEGGQVANGRPVLTLRHRRTDRHDGGHAPAVPACRGLFRARAVSVGGVGGVAPGAIRLGDPGDQSSDAARSDAASGVRLRHGRLRPSHRRGVFAFATLIPNRSG
jgi:hypothetical protein